MAALTRQFRDTGAEGPQRGRRPSRTEGFRFKTIETQTTQASPNARLTGLQPARTASLKRTAAEQDMLLQAARQAPAENDYTMMLQMIWVPIIILALLWVGILFGVVPNPIH